METLTIIAIIIGPLASVFISIFVNEKIKKKERKFSILSNLMRTRGVRLHQDHVFALNMVEIVFYGDSAVIDKYREYIEHLGKTPPAKQDEMDVFSRGREDKFNEMLKEMGKVIGYKFDKMDLNNFVYLPIGWTDMEEIQRKNNILLMEVLEGRRGIPVQTFVPSKESPFPPPPTSSS